MPTVTPAMTSCTSHCKAIYSVSHPLLPMQGTYSQIVSMNPLKNGKYARKVRFKEVRQ